MILIQLFLWKCDKVNEGQRVTISSLNVLYLWTPWAGIDLRGRFLEKFTVYESDELAHAIG